MENIKITYVGHSTALITSGDISLLTDPIFSPNILIVKRQVPPGIDPGKLPNITAVLISHTHIDHLDFASFNYIKTTVPIVMAEGSGKTANKHLPNPTIELSAWSSHEFSPDLKIHAVPVNHPNRNVPYRFKRATGYIIEIKGKFIFFAGDTAYDSNFRDIGNTYSIDAALLPISCYKPIFIMKRYHMDPVEAVQAFIDLNAKIMIPIHWGTFKLSLEKLSEPIDWLKKIVTERRLEDAVKILNPGESIDI